MLTLAIILVSISAMPVSSEEIAVFAGDAGNYNELLEGLIDTQFTIKYVTDGGTFYFLSEDWLTKGGDRA